MIPLGRHPVTDGQRYAGSLWVLDSRSTVGPMGLTVTMFVCRWVGQVRTFEVGEAELSRMLGRVS